MAAAEWAGPRSFGPNSHRSPYLFHRTQLGPPESSPPFRARRAIGGSAASRVRKRWPRACSERLAPLDVSTRRLDLLDGVIAECGRPAFLEDTRGASLVFEHEVRSLGEPRSDQRRCVSRGRSQARCHRMQAHGTRVRCLLAPAAASQRSKFRRAALRRALPHPAWAPRALRSDRNWCPYWTYLPHLFDWAADRDLRPCPFSEVYQLARNALAATVTATGFDQNSGHVLVVYDARNRNTSSAVRRSASTNPRSAPAGSRA